MPVIATEGRRRFLKWIGENRAERTDQIVADACSCTRAYVYKWRLGKGRPAAQHRAVLLVLAGIEPDLWLVDAEKALLRSAKRKYGSVTRAA